ncbi:MAG TPA: cytochrome C oxidase subunit IV family protein [Albitalea sp.]|nr:cytochrome C oxidase subunit IV family protein [Albitalea sp.]
MSHISPKSTYYAIFGALMALTALTIYVAFQHLGWLNFPVAISIALVKASLVVLFFMHVKYSSKLTKLLVASTFFFLAALFGLTMTDYMSRGWFTSPRGTATAGMLPKLSAAELPAVSEQALANPQPLFEATCGSCHSFTTKTAPTLAEIHELYSNDADKVVVWAKAPQRKRMRFEPMPSFAHLGEARLHALANYMLQQAAQAPPAAN